MQLSEEGKLEYKETKRIIREAMSNDQLVLFVGAGASVDSGMPLWGSAIDKIAEKLPLIEEQKDTLKIPQYYYNSRGKKEYTELMRDIFKYEDNLLPTKLHKKILDFQTTTIVTTNYDRLIETAAADNGEFIRVISQDIDMPYKKSRRELIKMHGDFEHDNFVLKEDDYLNYSRNFKLIETYVKSLIGSKVVLFIGYSLSDPDVKHIMSWVKDVLKEDFQRAYLILTKREPNSIEKDYFCNLGVNLIYGSKLVNDKELTHSEQLIEVLDYLMNEEQGNKLDVLYDMLKPFDNLNYVYGKYVINAFRKCGIICGENNSIDVTYLNDNLCNKSLINAILNVLENKECEETFDRDKIDTIIRVCEKSRFSEFRIKEGNKIVPKQINNVDISLIEKMIFKFDYEGLKELFEKNNSRLSSDNPNLYMQQAFISAFLYDYYKAYNYLKVAAKYFYVQKLYAWYFIAELNRKYVGKLVLSPFMKCFVPEEEKKTLENEIDCIDLDRVLNSIPDIGNESNVFLHELKNFSISYTLFYNVYADSLKTNEQAVTAYSLFSGTAAYESLRTKIKDFDRYETSNYIILDKYTENKSIFDLYIRTILSSINAIDITVRDTEGGCGNIKADALTDLDLYVILRYMQHKDLKKYFEQYSIKKIPLCEKAVAYLNDISKSICNETKYQKKTVFQTDRFWSYLELLCHTCVSSEIAKIVLERLIMIKNEMDISTYWKTIYGFINSICDENLYNDKEVCGLVKSLVNKILEIVIKEKMVSEVIKILLSGLLHFIDKGSVKYDEINLIRKLVEEDQRSLLFELYIYFSDEVQVIVKNEYEKWTPKVESVDQYIQYCSGVLANVLIENEKIEKDILMYILKMLEEDDNDVKNPIIICGSINHMDVLRQLINLYLNTKIIDIELLRKVVYKTDDEMLKWLLDMDKYDYVNFDCIWLTKCQQRLIELIVENKIARKSIINAYKKQYETFTNNTKINDIIINYFI